MVVAANGVVGPNQLVESLDELLGAQSRLYRIANCGPSRRRLFSFLDLPSMATDESLFAQPLAVVSLIHELPAYRDRTATPTTAHKLQVCTKPDLDGPVTPR